MKITALFFGVFAGCLSCIPAHGSNYIWNGGNGTWTDSGAWELDGSAADWNNGNTAQFQTESTITVENGIIASGLLYDGAALTFNGGSLTLTGAAAGSNGGSAAFSGTGLILDAPAAEDSYEVRDTSLTGSSTLTKTGAGTVTLAGTHTASGTWNINAGTLVFTGERNITATDNNRIDGKINIASGAVLDASNGRLFHNGVYTANYQSPTITLSGGTLKLNQFGYDSASLGKLHNNFYALKFASGTSSCIVISQGYESGGTASRGIYISGWGTTAVIELGANQSLTWNSSSAQDVIVCETGAGSALELAIGENSVLYFNQVFANKNTSNEYGDPTTGNFSGLSLIKSGAGELVIKRANTISSGRTVRVDAGKLTLDVDNAFGNGGNLGNVSIASGALFSMNGHTLSNVIDVQNGATLDMGGSAYASMVNWHEGGILLNTENNKGTLNIMTRAALELGSKAWAGSVLTDTDTVFTLTADQNLGALGANVNCWVGGRGYNNALQSITFTGDHEINMDNYGAKWAVILSENVTFQDIGNLTFSNNASNMADTDALYGAGAIAANDTVSFSSTGALTFNNNSVSADGGASGGAIYASGGASFINTGAISFSGNSAMTHGGAIYTGGTTGSLIFSDIAENISFTGNTAGENGGAINNDYETVEWSNVGHVTFSENIAEAGAGGAIWSGGDVTVNTAASFSMAGNEARDGSGGAIYSDGNVSFSGVDSLTFSGNHAYTSGGAIGAYGDITVSDSGTASFSGNTAYEGGALDAYNVVISGNTGTVLFENNSAENAGGAINVQGGGSVALTADQADIIFRGNTAVNGDIYNAIHFNDGSMASFNAADNRRVLFEDGLSSQDESVVDISINDAAGSGGTVAMSGANSQSDIRANTTVYGGTFSVTNGASYGYRSADWSTEEARTSFTVNGGTLHIGEQSTLNAADVSLEDGTQLSVMGTGSLNADTVTLGNNVSILGTGEGIFSMAANAIDMSNGITIDLSRGSMVGLELHADTLALGGTLTLGDDQVDYTAAIWQSDQSYLVMDASGVTSMDGTFSEILSSLSNSSTITVGNLGLEGYDPDLELGRWELRWDDGNALHLDWISNGLVVPEPSTSLLLLLAAGGLLAVRKRTI
ncbi:autotransporter-associated beta strand repeat-containing protein [Akkermansia sp.]|uniref:beta strand repeat-containing protein n=1 Tax=Akkermansia sp. TaxID=1872421 RepID=UPI0025C14053|nr:autotransporter-associated beta strand repeat-containing protein [Akkermansia sp.]MCC8148732.1 autotransporter-associated beta strand repeat-containing protein [Akkermansia sp.]